MITRDDVRRLSRLFYLAGQEAIVREKTRKYYGQTAEKVILFCDPFTEEVEQALVLDGAGNRLDLKMMPDEVEMNDKSWSTTTANGHLFEQIWNKEGQPCSWGVPDGEYDLNNGIIEQLNRMYIGEEAV